MGKKEDLTGRTFDRLEVIGEVLPKVKGKERRWLCRCECGNLTEASGGNLKRGHVKSCGCLRKETGLTNAMTANRAHEERRKADPAYRWGGHNRKELPDLPRYMELVDRKEITVTEACKRMGISRNTWRLRKKELIEKVETLKE